MFRMKLPLISAVVAASVLSGCKLPYRLEHNHRIYASCSFKN
jgi:hypothetical protein